MVVPGKAVRQPTPTSTSLFEVGLSQEKHLWTTGSRDNQQYGVQDSLISDDKLHCRSLAVSRRIYHHQCLRNWASGLTRLTMSDRARAVGIIRVQVNGDKERSRLTTIRQSPCQAAASHTSFGPLLLKCKYCVFFVCGLLCLLLFLFSSFPLFLFSSFPLFLFFFKLSSPSSHDGFHAELALHSWVHKSLMFVQCRR